MVAVSEIQMASDPERGNVVILSETPDAENYFMMFLGDSEFAAIAKEKGFVKPERPLTHDLYLSIIEKAPLKFSRIEIFDIRDDVYYARVIFQVDGREHIVDSRPSDAVALALNREVPILVAGELFRKKLSKKEIQEYETLVKTVKF
jgi:hypothetical protein